MKRLMLTALAAIVGFGSFFYSQTKSEPKVENDPVEVREQNARDLKLKLVGLGISIQRAAKNAGEQQYDQFSSELERRTMIEAALWEELDRRAEDIDRLADLIYDRDRCIFNNKIGSGEDFHTFIRIKAVDIGIYSGIRNPSYILEEELDKLRIDSLMPGDRIESVGDELAKARYYERCLGEVSGEDSYGILEMYRDLRKARFEGNCDTALILAEEIGFARDKFEVLKDCIPGGIDRQIALKDNYRRFYDAVQTANDDGLLASAGLVGYYEQPVWISTCTRNRFSRLPNSYGLGEARAHCVVDLLQHYEASGWVPSLNLRLDELDNLSFAINRGSVMSESSCYLDAYLIFAGRTPSSPLLFDTTLASYDYMQLCIEYVTSRRIN